MAACLVLASCAAGSPPVAGPTGTPRLVPAVISSDLAVGRNRFLLTVVDGATREPVVPPDRPLQLLFFALDRSETEPAARAGGRFVWIEPEREAAYAASVAFDTPGAWEVEPRGAGLPAVRVAFEVRPEPSTPRIGERVPASSTRTVDGVPDLARLTSDPAPFPRFYRTSIAGAMRSAIPFVVIFASPGRCSGTGCAHMLAVAKQVAAATSELTFIHVELFRDPDAGKPARLEPAVGEWGLPSEPWLFVVGADGRLVAKFERAVSESELRAAIEQLY